jgi:hypothetical protein
MASVEAIFVAILQIITLTKLVMRRRNKVQSLQSKAVSQAQTKTGNTTHVRVKISAKVEYKMVISIFCMAIAMALKICFYVWYLITQNLDALQFFIFVTDIFSLMSPILLLAFSEHTRKMLADFVFHFNTYST